MKKKPKTKETFDAQGSHLRSYLPEAYDRAAVVEPRMRELKAEYQAANPNEKDAIVLVLSGLIGSERLRREQNEFQATLKVPAGRDPGLFFVKEWDKVHDVGRSLFHRHVLYGSALGEKGAAKAWLET